MAAVLEKPDPAAKYTSQVDEQIAEATSRIRGHDLAFGGLVLAAMVLVYAAGMIVLDKYLVLPEWVRQAALAAFVAAAGATGYALVVRPFRRRVNPLYAAVRVEKTVEDAKNSVIGYIEAKDNAAVHPSVRAAMGARAAKSVGRADVNRAVDHRSLVYTGGAVVALLLALVVLFFLFRPAQFKSLVGRTFAPFTADPIATRTQLALVEPQAGDVTLTSGQSLTVKVEVGGRIPNPDKPDRVRVLLRHNPADPAYEELPLEKGETARNWQGRVPDYLVRNGFWYKVAGGDAETPEYKVTVRSLPLFTGYEVKYEFPAYTRRLPETTTDPHVEAYRGTKVTVVGKTNRAVKDGRLAFDPPTREAVAGKPVADRPDSLSFAFVVAEAGSYRLHFTTPDGERNADQQPFTIKVVDDQPPTVEIVKPEPDEISLPANGQLAVDATVGDDFGIDRIALRFKLLNADGTERPLADVPFQNGKSFLRPADNTWPRGLDYKDSADLTKLTDLGKQPVELKDGQVLLYWVEAADNRTKAGAAGPEPDPNVGRSKVKRVRITPAVTEPEPKADLDGRKQDRKTDEAKHNKDQQQKLDNEKRDPPPPKKDGEKRANNGGENQPKPPEAAPPKDGEQGTGQPKPMTRDPNGSEKKSDTLPAKDDSKKPPEGKQGAQDPPKKGENDPNATPPDMTPGGMKDAGTAPPPSEPGGNDARKTADRVQEKLNEEKQGGGGAKGNPEAGAEDRVPPADAKPEQPKDAAPPKDAPKPDAGMNGDNAAGASKPAGDVQKPEDPSAPKPEQNAPEQNAGGNPSGPKAGNAPSSDTKPEPFGTAPATDKETPKPKPQANPNDPPPKPQADPTQPKSPQDPAGAGAGKPPTQQDPKGDATPMTTPGGADQPPAPADAAGKPKPLPNNDRGADKAAPPDADPKGGPQPEAGTQPADAGNAKPEKAPTPGAPKPTPKDQDPMPNGDGTGAAKPAPPENGADPMGKAGTPGETKPDAPPPGSTDPKNGGPSNTAKKPVDKAEDKPAPGTKNAGGSDGEQPKIDPKKKEEFEKSVKDLADKNATPGQKQAARDNLDKSVGEKNRKEIEDVAKGLGSDDPKQQDAARQKLEDLKKQADAAAGKAGGDPKKAGTRDKAEPKKGSAGGGDPKTKIDPKEIENAANDLAGDDPVKKQAARDKLDKTVGPDARKQAEAIADDLKSGDPERQKRAQEKLNDLQKKAEAAAQKDPANKEPKGGAGGGQKNDTKDTAADQKKDADDVARAMKDLNDPDPKTREAAKQKLDEKLGKGAGDRAEEINKGLNSKDEKEQAAARRKLDEMKKQAAETAKNGTDPKGTNGNDAKQPKSKELTRDEVEDLKNKLDDLKSPDADKRKAAEEAFDKKFGEENRKKLQDGMKDQPGDAMQQSEEAQRKLDEIAKNPGAGGYDADGNRTPTGAGRSNPEINDAMKDDPKNRAKSAELQLEQFEKNRFNKDLQERLGMSQDDYDRFLGDFRKEVDRLKQDATEPEKADVPPPTTTPTNVGSGGKVEARPNATTGPAGATGAAFAAPGFADALKKFQEDAAKRGAMKK